MLLRQILLLPLIPKFPCPISSAVLSSLQVKEPEKPLTVLLVTFPSSSLTGGTNPPLNIPCFKLDWRETVQLDLFPGPWFLQGCGYRVCIIQEFPSPIPEGATSQPFPCQVSGVTRQLMVTSTCSPLQGLIPLGRRESDTTEWLKWVIFKQLSSFRMTSLKLFSQEVFPLVLVLSPEATENNLIPLPWQSVLSRDSPHFPSRTFLLWAK